MSLVALVLVGGCNRDDTATALAPETVLAKAIAAAATSAPSDPAATPITRHSMAPAAPTTPPVPDATTTLAAALDALATGYHFVTTARVDGRVAMTAEGDHVAGTTQMTVIEGGTRTRYLVTQDAAWAHHAGAWHRLDSTQGLTDPVGQLRSPTSVELEGTAEAATITAHYRATTLGLRGANEHAVEFRLTNGLITSLSYTGVADGTTRQQRTEVTTSITPIAPGTEITLPDAEA